MIDFQMKLETPNIQKKRQNKKNLKVNIPTKNMLLER